MKLNKETGIELAKEYSNSICPREDYIDEQEYNIDRRINFDDAKSVLGWLEENFNVEITPKT